MEQWFSILTYCVFAGLFWKSIYLFLVSIGGCYAYLYLAESMVNKAGI